MVLGHGTTQNDSSAAPVYQHTAELRRRKIFAAVREAFWKQEPQIKKVLPEISAPRVFIVPLFISEGYFSDEVIPRELGFSEHSTLNPIKGRGPHGALRPQPSTIYYCQPVGSHDSMTAVLLSRAKEMVEKFPFPRAPKPKDITLFIAGHGTEKNENSRKPIERQVELVEVDLRWGIAEEQATRKETLKLCLDEIRSCRPFFIGLVGERYGWAPEPRQLKARGDSQRQQSEKRSTTDVEMLHGVLKDRRSK